VKFEVRNGCFAYREGARQILNGVSFALEPGELTAVLGPNGAGKTTLLRCMTGLLPWRSGASLIDGEDIRAMRRAALWRRLAYVPQARGTASALRVKEMVLLGRSGRLSALSQPSREDARKAGEAIERLGLEGLRGRLCSQLSGGELQMVLIARALAAEPEMLVLDEPESNLDFKNQLIILETLSDLAAKGMTCVFNTHYPSHALQRAHRSLLLGRDGSWRFGASDSVITEKSIASAFGVRAVIGEIETPHNIYRDILPVSLLTMELDTPAEPVREETDMETRIAIIGIIVEDREAAERINELLHEFGEYVVGRMGMPYPPKNVSIISVIVDAPEDVISALSGRLGMLRGVSIKTTYSKR